MIFAESTILTRVAVAFNNFCCAKLGCEARIAATTLIEAIAISFAAAYRGALWILAYCASEVTRLAVFASVSSATDALFSVTSVVTLTRISVLTRHSGCGWHRGGDSYRDRFYCRHRFIRDLTINSWKSWKSWKARDRMKMSNLQKSMTFHSKLVSINKIITYQYYFSRHITWCLDRLALFSDK